MHTIIRADRGVNMGGRAIFGRYSGHFSCRLPRAEKLDNGLWLVQGDFPGVQNTIRLI
jgi:hypothetical protein